MAEVTNDGGDLGSALKEADDVARRDQDASSERLLGRVVSRALADPAFLDSLSRDPKSAVEREAKGLGIAVPPATLELAERVPKLSSKTLPDLKDDEVGKLILGTIAELKESFKSTLRLASILFYAGLAMTLVAFAVGVFAQGKEIISGLFGAGGLLTLISYVLMNPLDRIRNAAANLVQVQLAYLSYYKQLNLLGGGGEKLSRDDALAYAKELRDGASQMIGSVQGVLEKSVAVNAPAAASVANDVQPARLPPAPGPATSAGAALGAPARPT
jgi:hypothetical protein